ncbi:MAG TPA: MarR family transcriptional regulator, partial [Pseudomonas sp.]|nr:MarR family transcriptional regulator [Pseudomonas sp.]
EAAGLIQRVPNPEDRRSLLIRLSDEGQKVLLGCLDEYLATLHEMQAPLDAQQKQALAAGLRTLLLALEEGRDD